MCSPEVYQSLFARRGDMPGPVETAYAGVEGQQPLGSEYNTPLVRSPMAGHVFMSRIGEGNVGPGPLFLQRDERFEPYQDFRANVPGMDQGFTGPEVGGPEFKLSSDYGLSRGQGQSIADAIEPFDRKAASSRPAFDPKGLANWLTSLKK